MKNHVPAPVTTATLLVALGIIYGDIGTSPLYVLKAIIEEQAISPMLVYGGISCVFWTLVFQTSIKYITFTLMADNHGEGGIFSLYALVRRFGKRALIIATILGATALLADGFITPPISVASAVEGLDLVMPHLPTVPIVVVILSGLFFFQRFGTQIVGRVFGPVMVVWFAMLLVLGGWQITQHPDIIQALNPYHAYNLLVHYPGGFWLLGGVFLCTTGAEALYSDLGHCGRKNIRLTWIYVKICLVVNYMGQAAWLLTDAGPTLDGRNPFFAIMPAWFIWPGILIATAATIIASQALISGSYTLISEAISMNFWPRVAVRNPTDMKGQIYIPSVNSLLWAGCVGMIVYFQNSTNMEAAYGFSITIAMLMTTFLLTVYLVFIKKWRKWVVFGIISVFVLIESAFFLANAAKAGEAKPVILLAVCIFSTMYVWHYARKINNRLVRFVKLKNHTGLIRELSEDDSIPKFSTHLIYLTKANRKSEVEEKIVKSIFSKKPKRADVYWFVHIHRTDEPYTLNYQIEEILDDKVIKVNINTGFRVQPRVELYFKKIVQDLVAKHELNLHIRPDGSTRYNPEPDFKFVVIEKFLSVENEFALTDGLLLNTYFWLKRLGQSDEKAFGLDKSDVVVEQVPLIYQPVTQLELSRK